MVRCVKVVNKFKLHKNLLATLVIMVSMLSGCSSEKNIDFKTATEVYDFGFDIENYEYRYIGVVNDTAYYYKKITSEIEDENLSFGEYDIDEFVEIGSYNLETKENEVIFSLDDISDIMESDKSKLLYRGVVDFRIDENYIYFVFTESYNTNEIHSRLYSINIGDTAEKHELKQITEVHTSDINTHIGEGMLGSRRMINLGVGNLSNGYLIFNEYVGENGLGNADNTNNSNSTEEVKQFNYYYFDEKSQSINEIQIADGYYHTNGPKVYENQIAYVAKAVDGDDSEKIVIQDITNQNDYKVYEINSENNIIEYELYGDKVYLSMDDTSYYVSEDGFIFSGVYEYDLSTEKLEKIIEPKSDEDYYFLKVYGEYFTVTDYTTLRALKDDTWYKGEIGDSFRIISADENKIYISMFGMSDDELICINLE